METTFPGDEWYAIAYDDYEGSWAEIGHGYFDSEADATDWAGDNGWLDNDQYKVTVEDPNGTVTTL